MCYDIKTKLEAMLKRARFSNDEQRIQELLQQLEPYVQEDYYHVSGFAHPLLPIYTQQDPYWPKLCQWGLIPSWVKGNEDRKRMENQTLNARGETIFEKASFRHSARNKRGLLYVSGFFEHHELNGNKYPFFIRRKDGEPMIFATLWSEWIDKESGEVISSYSIVTTEANPMMAKIHNNPKLPEPRMPVILHDENADDWLRPWRDDTDSAFLTDMMQPFPQSELEAWPVRRLRGKDAVGNVPEANERYEYEELDLELN
ncbi:MAG: SOS response-associated peptidase [Bacteroidetes bacterium]|nr:SOS response-associated peptidase [Bacteroidota bacterium]